MTLGRTNLTLTIQPCGRIYDLGSGGPPGGNYQFNMVTNSRGIYQAYTHTDPVLNPTGETQGSAPVTTVRPSPTVSTLSPGGTFYNGISNYLSGRMSANVTNFTVNDFLQLAKAYSVSNFSVSYTNPALVTKVIAGVDCYASNYYANTSVVNGWGGNYGPIGWAVHLLFPSLQSSLDVTNNFGAGGSVSRRKAWGDLLLASREYGRLNRNDLSNQGLISGSYIYMANRALLDLTNTSAFAETNAQRYLLEAIGLSPWTGDDLAGGGSDYLHGTNYFQVTPKGLTREWGYVGAAYGEMQFYAADFYSWTTNPVFLAQCVKMAKARANFRRPAIDVSGNNYYQAMEGIGLLAWRGANESDAEFADEICYGDRTGWALGLRCAAATGDTNLVGFAKQMLADNQYFNNLTVSSTEYSAIGNQGDSRDALDVFNDYKIVSNAADSGVRLPMTDGQPDFAWADEENGIVAVKHGNERLWLETYYQAKTGTGVNGVGRFYYSTNNFDRYGMLEVSPQINFNGAFYNRPNIMDKPEQNFYVPPDDPLQAYQYERLPVATDDPLATDDEPFRGKALFWATRYGNFLVGINRSAAKTYQLQTPSDFVSATNLVTGQNLSGTIYVAPQSTVILYLSSALDSCPPPQAPLSLNATGDATPRIVLDWSRSSGAGGYNVKRADSSGGPYTTIANVTTTNYTDAGVTRGASYFYVVSATNSCGESFYNSMEDFASGGLPVPWLDTDIGSVGVAGGGNYNSGTFTISGEGFDIGSTSDTLNFGYMTMTNDGIFIAHLATEQFGGSADDKIGIMFRESTNANSKTAAVLIDGALGKARLPVRSSTGGSMSWIDGPAASVPKWFKLQRAGNVFTGFVSSDGMTWTGVGTNTFSMNSVLLAGFAVCSRNSGTLNVSTFDNVSLPAWSPPPSAPLNLTATASNAAVFLQWNPAASATGYKLKRALVSGGGYNLIASQVATNYTDSAVTNGTFYYYVVTATNAAGDSAVSAEVFAQPESLVPPPLSVQALGNQLQFQWPLDHLGWRMQAQTNSSGTGLGANWTTVTGSSATNLIWLPLEPGNGSVFFRLIYP
jgi:regulation of enolase protein 1 (concanavalin A-like superfamily)